MVAILNIYKDRTFSICKNFTSKASEAFNFSGIPFYKQGLWNHLFVVTLVPSSFPMNCKNLYLQSSHSSPVSAQGSHRREEGREDGIGGPCETQKDEDRACWALNCSMSSKEHVLGIPAPLITSLLDYLPQISHTRKLLAFTMYFISSNCYSHLVQNLPLPLKITQGNSLSENTPETPDSCAYLVMHQKDAYKEQLESLGYDKCMSCHPFILKLVSFLG